MATRLISWLIVLEFREDIHAINFLTVILTRCVLPVLNSSPLFEVWVIIDIAYQVIQVNLKTVFTLSRDIGAHMLQHEPSPITGRRGSIIQFASLLSFQGGLTVPAYAASKGAVAQMTKSFANEWTSKGVNVNAIAPGYIATDMNDALLKDENRLRSISERIPAGRWGSPEDFKGSVVYLSSRASGYVSGHVLLVDGGWMGR